MQTTPQLGAPNARLDIPGAASAATSRSPSGFHIQLGAFNVLENAQGLIQTLRSKGYSGSLVEFAERPRYRVWVGDFPDRSSAERLAARLRATGFEGAVVSLEAK